MAEGTYEYECMRAELLGMPKPDEQEWLEKQKERLEHESEEIDEKTLEELESQNDELKNVSGGLDELNNILSITQKKLNRFKSACGSLTNLLKIKVGTEGSSESISKTESEIDEKSAEENSDHQSVSSDCQKSNVPAGTSVQNGARKADKSISLNNQVEKLDCMVTKAENLQLRMEDQQKRMKKLLK